MASVKEIENEIESAAETAIEINNLTEMKNDHPTQPHNGKKIDRIIVSQYNEPYVVTYSKEDNSVLGWLINAEENGQQRPDVYFKLDQNYHIYEFVLYKKFLVFFYFYEYFSKYLFDTKIYLNQEFFCLI
jgi:hypothetical protein